MISREFREAIPLRHRYQVFVFDSGVAPPDGALPLVRPKGKTKTRPKSLALLCRVPGVEQMNAGSGKTRCAQTVAPADRRSSIRLRRRLTGGVSRKATGQTPVCRTGEQWRFCESDRTTV